MFLVSKKKSLVFTYSLEDNNRTYQIEKNWEAGIKLAITKDLVSSSNFADRYFNQLLKEYSLL